MKRWPWACCWLSLAGAACDDARLVDGFSEGVTQIRVEPEAFVGGVECQPGAAGALQGYVVKLEVVGAGAAGDASVEGDVQWSPFVPCDRTVAFPAVGGRLYAADIRGFDRALEVSELESAEGRWSASCGRGSAVETDAGADPHAPTRASSGASVLLLGCTQFAPGGGLGSLIVDVAGALGALQCGSGAGQVAWLTARLGPTEVTAACGEPLVVPVGGLSRHHTIDLFAFEAISSDGGLVDAGSPVRPPDAAANGLDSGAGDAGDAGEAGAPSPPPPPTAEAGAGSLDAGSANPPGVLRWQAQCFGRSIPGVSARAACEPLRAVGP